MAMASYGNGAKVFHRGSTNEKALNLKKKMVKWPEFL
jgi:hypothetical protein